MSDTRAEMRAFYPVCQGAELAAGYRDTTRRLFDFTIWRTGVVDIAGRVPEDLAINIIALIKGKTLLLDSGVLCSNVVQESSLDNSMPLESNKSLTPRQQEEA